MSNGDVCLLDSATTHTILKEKKCFSNLVMKIAYVNTISGSTKLIEGSGRATLLLPRGTILRIDNALYRSKSQRNLLSFKVTRQMAIMLRRLMKERLNTFTLLQLMLRRKLCMKNYLHFLLGCTIQV